VSSQSNYYTAVAEGAVCERERARKATRSPTSAATAAARQNPVNAAAAREFILFSSSFSPPPPRHPTTSPSSLRRLLHLRGARVDPTPSPHRPPVRPLQSLGHLHRAVQTTMMATAVSATELDDQRQNEVKNK